MAFGRKASLCFQVLYLENIAQWKHRLRDKRETTASVCTHIVSSFTKFFKMPNEFTDNFLELKQVKHSQISYFLYAKWRFLSLKYFFGQISLTLNTIICNQLFNLISLLYKSYKIETCSHKLQKHNFNKNNLCLYFTRVISCFRRAHT